MLTLAQPSNADPSPDPLSLTRRCRRWALTLTLILTLTLTLWYYISPYLPYISPISPQALQKMGTLSGGQKSRIAFAQV